VRSKRRRKKQRLVTGALYSVERFAETIKENARRDAELALKKARNQADEIVGEARRDRARLDREAQRLESLTTQMRSDLMSTLASVLDDLEADVSPDGASSSRSIAPASDTQQTAGS
jgi:cell division septum initiation protein DivIVA